MFIANMCKVGKESAKSVSTFKSKDNKLEKDSRQYRLWVSLTWDEYDMKCSIPVQCFKETKESKGRN